MNTKAPEMFRGFLLNRERIAVGLAEMEFQFGEALAQAGGEALQNSALRVGMKGGDDRDAMLSGAEGVGRAPGAGVCRAGGARR